MKLIENYIMLDKNEVNTGRQFEFDLAKFICILGMVFVHIFEEFPVSDDTVSGSAYYIMVIVLDAVFGAGTFMGCMGFGIAYSKHSDYAQLMKRGFWIFVLGYILNVLRYGLPSGILSIFGLDSLGAAFIYTLWPDILQFAGLALFLFGFLKKLNLSDLGLLAAAVVLSVIGSIFRFVDIGNVIASEFAALFISDYCYPYDVYFASFPLLNWFIIVVLGYLYGKFMRRVRDIDKYYAFAFPVSAVLLGIYMAAAIPLHMGMMNESINYYYAFVTPEALVLFTGMVFATSLYHYIGRLLSVRAKDAVTKVSANINSIYCIHWVVLMWLSYVFDGIGAELPSSVYVFLLGIVIFVVSIFIADVYKGKKGKRKVKNA